jgi:hypothetical protein
MKSYSSRQKIKYAICENPFISKQQNNRLAQIKRDFFAVGFFPFDIFSNKLNYEFKNVNCPAG